MSNYSDMIAHTRNDEDKAQVMRAVFCPFMRHCLIITGVSLCGIGADTFASIL